MLAYFLDSLSDVQYAALQMMLHFNYVSAWTDWMTLRIWEAVNGFRQEVLGVCWIHLRQDGVTGFDFTRITPPGQLSLEASGCTSSSFSSEVQQATTMKVVLQFCANSSLSWAGWCNGGYVTSCLDYVSCSTWDCPRGPLRNRNNLLLSLYNDISRAALVAGLLPDVIEVADHNYKALNSGQSGYTQVCLL